jgi:hypothetical protein
VTREDVARVDLNHGSGASVLSRCTLQAGRLRHPIPHGDSASLPAIRASLHAHAGCRHPQDRRQRHGKSHRD